MVLYCFDHLCPSQKSREMLQGLAVLPWWSSPTPPQSSPLCLKPLALTQWTGTVSLWKVERRGGLPRVPETWGTQASESLGSSGPLSFQTTCCGTLQPAGTKEKERPASSSQSTRKSGLYLSYILEQNNKPQPKLALYIKINSKWTMDLNVKCRTLIKHLGKKWKSLWSKARQRVFRFDSKSMTQKRKNW